MYAVLFFFIRVGGCCRTAKCSEINFILSVEGEKNLTHAMVLIYKMLMFSRDFFLMHLKKSSNMTLH